MPPPNPAELPDRALLVMVRVPELKMAPPCALKFTELPDRMVLVTVKIPELQIAPPPAPKLVTLLPVRVLSATVNVPPLMIPPPQVVDDRKSNPFAIVRRESETVTPAATENTTKLLSPLTVIVEAGRPWIVRLSVICGSVL